MITPDELRAAIRDARRSPTADQIFAFVAESNRIEGITRAPTADEIEASLTFVTLPSVSVDHLRDYVQVCAGAPLRTRHDMDVRVGDHRPPPGGPAIERALEAITQQAGANHAHPYLIHHAYETLHPFMDGNGRSGRILWAWQMLTHGYSPGLALGFLHAFYYQALSHGQGRAAASESGGAA